MAGHSKWKQIKEKKAKTDAKKSQVFSKYAKLITSEAKKAGGDLSSPGLKAVVERARSENMPSDNIERAIKKATEVKAAMETITYEAYGPGGVAMIIEALTDNRNKAAQEIKFILSEHGANLAGIGAASWAFEKKGVEWIPQTTTTLSDDDLSKLEKLVEALETNDEVQAVFTNAD